VDQSSQAAFSASALRGLRAIEVNAPLVVRPIEAGDRCALAAAFARLSPQSRMRRFLAPKPYLSARELTYLTDLDHVTHEALVALDARGQIVAVARYAAWPPARRDAAEIAVTVVDAFQRRGIGSALAAQVIERARAGGFASLTASTFFENYPARALMARLGFRRVSVDDGVASYRLALPAVDAAARTSGSCRRDETSSLRNACPR
jgi:RimJ/RimL family protein N-acetyltransferase